MLIALKNVGETQSQSTRPPDVVGGVMTQHQASVQSGQWLVSLELVAQVQTSPTVPQAQPSRGMF